MRKIAISKWVIEAIKICEVSDRRQLEKIEFQCMKNYTSSLLLNMDTVKGRRSIASRKRISISQRGDKSDRFNHGSITEIHAILQNGTKTHYFRFAWIEWMLDVRSLRSKSFSINKYGEKTARRMAEAFRDEIYPPTK